MKKLFLTILFTLVLCAGASAEIFELKNCKYIDPVAIKANKGVGNISLKIDTIKNQGTWNSSNGKRDFYNISGNFSSGFKYIERPFFDDDKNSYGEWFFDIKNGIVNLKVYDPNFNEYLSKQGILNCDRNINATSKVEIANLINKAKDTCKSLGFKEGTEKFADCSLKLYSQSVELAAEQNKQIVMQPQQSGSNVITIYDPVRDSNALMDKGMKMLSGGCTLGIDC